MPKFKCELRAIKRFTYHKEIEADTVFDARNFMIEYYENGDLYAEGVDEIKPECSIERVSD